jgi:hypothetical protein
MLVQYSLENPVFTYEEVCRNGDITEAVTDNNVMYVPRMRQVASLWICSIAASDY